MNKYSIEIFFSEEDEGFIAVVPELPGCSAFGSTEEKALKEVMVAIDLWIETARSEEREVPEPLTFENESEYSDLLTAIQRLSDPNDGVVTLAEAKHILGI